MIRREIEISDNEKLWLLISQVDHAHISGELTAQSTDSFSEEVVEAVTHHDDGWAQWETAARINPEVGGPYSFLEMPLAEALPIWDGSIESARRFGPLAGFIVAGHFYNLLSESDHAKESAAVAWLAAKRKVRTAWLDEWARADPSHTLEEAKRAQQQLLLADLFSLWLCCDAPVAGEPSTLLEQSSMKLRTETLLSRFKCTTIGFGRRHPTLENPLEAMAWIIGVEPYPFRTAPLSMAISGQLVPVARYQSWADVQSAARTVEIRWRLMPPAASANGET
jgi:hypothetical protein